MNINNNGTSTIVDGVFRLVRAASALCGPVEQTTIFMLLDRFCGALVLCTVRQCITNKPVVFGVES